MVATSSGRAGPAMSRERKNDRHVPLGPARRLVPRPSNASVSRRIRRGLQWFEKQKHRETLVRMLSQSCFSRARRFFAFLRMRSSLIPVRCRFPDCRRRRRRDRLLPRRLRTTGSRSTRLHSSPRTETSRRRERAKWCARTRRPFAAFASRRSRNRPGVDRRRVAAASRDRASSRSIPPADADRA